jgi:hypothetical protein
MVGASQPAQAGNGFIGADQDRIPGKQGQIIVDKLVENLPSYPQQGN